MSTASYELRQPARALACGKDGSTAQWLVVGCTARERGALVALQASAGRVANTNTWQLQTPAGASALACSPDARLAATLHPGPSGSGRASLHVWGLTPDIARKLACDADHASQQQSVAWSHSDCDACLTSSSSALTSWKIHQDRVAVRIRLHAAPLRAGHLAPPRVNVCCSRSSCIHRQALRLGKCSPQTLVRAQAHTRWCDSCRWSAGAP